MHLSIDLALGAQVPAVTIPALQRLVLAGVVGVIACLVCFSTTLQRFHGDSPAAT
jgi:hypothetical protein